MLQNKSQFGKSKLTLHQTLIIYLRQATAKKQEQCRAAEATVSILLSSPRYVLLTKSVQIVKYNTVRGQLGAETGAGPAIPAYMQLAIERSEAAKPSAHQLQDISNVQSAAESASDHSDPVLSALVTSADPQFDVC